MNRWERDLRRLAAKHDCELDRTNGFLHAHCHSGVDVDGFRVVTIFRDPRNCLVSYVRHRKAIDGVEVSIPEALADYWGAPFVETYASFLGWRGKSIVVRYEDMPPAVIGEGAGLYAYSDHDYNTRTGSPSRWQDVWSDEIDVIFSQHGGPALLKAAGYE